MPEKPNRPPARRGDGAKAPGPSRNRPPRPSAPKAKPHEFSKPPPSGVSRQPPATPPADPGTSVGSVDMGTRADNRMVQSLISRSKYQPSVWPLTDEKRRQIFEAGMAGVALALRRQDPRLIMTAVQTMAMMNGQNIDEGQFMFKHAEPEQPTVVHHEHTVRADEGTALDTMLEFLADPAKAVEVLRLSRALNADKGE